MTNLFSSSLSFNSNYFNSLAFIIVILVFLKDFYVHDLLLKIISSQYVLLLKFQIFKAHPENSKPLQPVLQY